MLKQMTIKMKLLVSVIGAILTVALIIEVQSIYSLKTEAEEIISKSEKSAYKEKEKELENYVSLAYKTIESYHARTAKDKIKSEVEEYITEQSNFLFSIITGEYEKNKNLLSEEELKSRIISIIKNTRYGEAGYFWINDFDYNMVMHPIKEELTGKKFKNTPKVAFVELGVNKLKSTKKDSGFIEYSFYSPKSKKTVYKSSIVKVFKPYDWIIGTGAYVDDVTSQMKKEALNAISNMRYGKSGYFWINDSNHIVQMHPLKPSLDGKSMYDLKDKKGTFFYRNIVKTANAKKDGGIVKYYGTIDGKEGSFEKYSYVKKFEAWDFIIGTGSYVINIEEDIKKMKKNIQEGINSKIINSIIIILIILVLISFILTLILNKLIVNPINKFQDGLLDFFRYINKEQTDIDLLEVYSNDEIGKMTSLINENILKSKTIIEQDNILITDVKEIVNHVGNGYLDKKITSSTNNESLEELKNLINTMLDNLQGLVGNNINALSNILEKYEKRDFTHKIDSLNSGKIGLDIENMNKMITKILQDNQKDGLNLQSKSRELTSNVKVLNENANSQAASLEETAASIEEITSNIKQTSEKAQEMLSISTKTQNSSNIGKNLASKTVKAMDEINETVMNINDAITVIDQIAFQTNILSLNAAVEAATAGESGKGFAVVAQEVRNLASRSAEAAKEIKELVEMATVRANEGKEVSSSMIEGFNELENNITTTSNLINDVSNSAREQSAGIVQISDAVNQLDRVTQENAAVADKTNNIALDTNNIAIDIVENVNNNKFDGKV